MMMIQPPNYLVATLRAEREREAAHARLAAIAAARASRERSAGPFERILQSIRRPASTCPAAC